VLECLSGYLLLAARLSQEPKTSPLASAFNFGPEPSARQCVRRLVEEFLKTWTGKWTDGSNPDSPHEAKLLSLSIEKAGALLGWHPCWDFEEAVHRTAVWYHRRHAANNNNLLSFSIEQIEGYVQAAQRKGLTWAESA
jgi:CDP-glucose 4,6-dehydratase